MNIAIADAPRRAAVHAAATMLARAGLAWRDGRRGAPVAHTEEKYP